MKQVLTCENCDAVLSKPVIIHKKYIEKPWEKRKSFVSKLFSFRKKEIHKNKGLVFVNFQNYMESICDEGLCIKSETAWLGIQSEVMGFTPQFWMNNNDLLVEELDENNVEDQWCCGPSGWYGPNILCICGVHIGTACLECGSPNVFIPDNEKTKWKNVRL